MTETPTIATMTAEVRVITIGANRLTLSMYRQLDVRRFDRLTLFGRVRSGVKVEDEWGGLDLPELELIGRDSSGQLVRSYLLTLSCPPKRYQAEKGATKAEHEAAFIHWDALAAELRRLPLIVLGR